MAMELVRGLPITEFCAARRLGIRERLELFLGVCHQDVRIDHRRIDIGMPQQLLDGADVVSFSK